MPRAIPTHFDDPATKAVADCASRGGRRLTAAALLEAVVQAAVPISLLGLAAACVNRLSGAPDWPWWWIVAGLGVLLLVLVASRWRACRVDVVAAAMVVDERLSLHDALSTALALGDDTDNPVARGQRAAAAAIAAQPGMDQKIRAATPITWPPRWWVPALTVVVAVVVAGMPSLFGTHRHADSAALADARIETDSAIAQMYEALNASPELQTFLGEQPELVSSVELTDPTLIRQQAVQSLTDLQRQLDDFELDPSQRRLERVKDRLADLGEGKHESTTETRRALAAGDFERAAETMAAMEQTEHDAAALDTLADDLREVAASDAELQEKLRKAGVQARENESIADAIKNAEHVDELTREELARLLEDQQAASEALDDMARDCEQAASRCRNQKQAEQSSSPTACDELAEAQQASEQAESCRSACAASRRLAGSGLGSGGLPESGSASRFFGGGGPRPFAGESPTATVPRQASSEVDTQSPVVGNSAIDGPLRRGTLSESGEAAVLAAKRRVARGIDVQRIPRRYQQAVAAWFAQPPPADAADSDEEVDEQAETP